MEAGYGLGAAHRYTLLVLGLHIHHDAVKKQQQHKNRHIT